MAAALLASRLTAAGVRASVRSAGLHVGPYKHSVPPEVVSAMAAYRLDVAGHNSRGLTADELGTADLVIALARKHLRYAVVTTPTVWPRAFTLRELVRRGQQTGPRRSEEQLDGWLSRVHAGRERSALLGDSSDDDIADPSGRPLEEYIATAAQLDYLLAQLISLAWD